MSASMQVPEAENSLLYLREKMQYYDCDLYYSNIFTVVCIFRIF